MTATQLLKNISLFEQLPPEKLEEVAARLESRTLEEREVLFEMGEPGDELYVVESGTVGIYVPQDDAAGEERPIRLFKAGEVLGEMALIDARPRSASARALEPSRLLVLGEGAFKRLLEQSPEMALAVMAGLNDRIRYTTDFLAEVRAWVQRVAEGKYGHRFRPSQEYGDDSLEALAAEFARMAAQVRKREEVLRKEVMELRIEINESKRQREVDEITESDYFQQLRRKAKEIRDEK